MVAVAPGRIRTKIGISQDAIADLAATSRRTVRIYEAHPDAVGSRDPNVRRRLDWIYAELESLMTRAHHMRIAPIEAS